MDERGSLNYHQLPFSEKGQKQPYTERNDNYQENPSGLLHKDQIHISWMCTDLPFAARM